MRKAVLFCISFALMGCAQPIVGEEIRLSPEMAQFQAVNMGAHEVPNAKSEMLFVDLETVKDKAPRQAFEFAKNRQQTHRHDVTCLVGCVVGNVQSLDRFHVQRISSRDGNVTVVLDLVRPESFDGEPGPARVYFVVDLTALRQAPKSVKFKISNWNLRSDGRLEEMKPEALADFEAPVP